MEYIVELNKTYEEAKAGETKDRRLITANEFFQIPREKLRELGKDCNSDWWISEGLLARDYSDFGDFRRNVFADNRSSYRFGVLYVIDKPHTHKFVKQPAKCSCGQEGSRWIK